MQQLRIAARGSRLSRIQVEEVMRRLPGVRYEMIYTDTYGDRHHELSLLNGEAPDDIFTRELDAALISGRADVAIHSAKDLPAVIDRRIEVIALYEAFDKTDSLVSRGGLRLSELPPGSTVGTSSPLRKEGILRLRPDLRVVSIRGCIEERVAQVDGGSIDSVIVATCALKRLGMENRIAEVLPFATHPMQGRLAVTALKRREDLRQIFSQGSLI